MCTLLRGQEEFVLLAKGSLVFSKAQQPWREALELRVSPVGEQKILKSEQNIDGLVIQLAVP